MSFLKLPDVPIFKKEWQNKWNMLEASTIQSLTMANTMKKKSVLKNQVNSLEIWKYQESWSLARLKNLETFKDANMEDIDLNFTNLIDLYYQKTSHL